MRNIRVTFSILFLLSTVIFVYAQNNNYRRDSEGNNKNTIGRRFNRQCTEPFSMRSFNRDYAGLSSVSYYHLNKALRDYARLHCLSSEQVRRLAMLYPTDREKYDYLTYSLTYVFDIENYALAGTVIANRNARDAFYRFLVHEGVPAGDYYADPYFAQGGYYNTAMMPPPPQYYDRYGNAYNNLNNRNAYDNQYNTNDGYASKGLDNGNNRSDYRNDNLNGINGGYQGLMTYKEFEILKERIRQNTFDKGKLESAKSMTQQNTLTSNQISEITRLFNNDNNRLEYAKFAYDYAYDRENYAAVVEAMAFEANKKEMHRYVESRRRD